MAVCSAKNRDRNLGPEECHGIGQRISRYGQDHRLARVWSIDKEGHWFPAGSSPSGGIGGLSRHVVTTPLVMEMRSCIAVAILTVDSSRGWIRGISALSLSITPCASPRSGWPATVL